MKKIGSLDNGNLLIEMTPDEWERIQSNPDTSIALTLEQQAKSFYRKSKSLAPYVNIRVRNLITKSYTYPKAQDSFRDGNGNFLEFEEWCNYTLSRQGRNLDIPNLGKKMKSQLLEGIKQYKTAKDDKGELG